MRKGYVNVYMGQVIGENTRMDDLTLNIIRNDKCIEVTPKNMPIRKIFLNKHDRKRQTKGVTE